MMPASIFMVCLSIAVLAVLIAPFLFGQGEKLSEALSVNSPERLRKTQELLLQRYLQDEKAFQAGDISERTWEARKSFIAHRYIDAARRLDYLSGQEKTNG